MRKTRFTESRTERSTHKKGKRGKHAQEMKKRQRSVLQAKGKKANIELNQPMKLVTERLQIAENNS